MPDRVDDTLQQLVARALRDAVDLGRHEFALFRTEMSNNVGKMAGGVGMFAVAGVFAIASLIWLTQALVYGLDLIIHSRWLSALIVGALLLAVAIVLVLVGKSRMSAATLTPSRTVRSLQRDGEILTERTS